MKVFVMSLILSFSAIAKEAQVNLIDQALEEDQCSQVGLTQEQMDAVKSEYLVFLQKKIDIYAKIKKAKLSYLQEVLKSDATYDSAMAKASEIASAKQEKMMAKFESRTGLIFNVLTFEQRKYGIQCLKGIEKKVDEYLKETMGD